MRPYQCAHAVATDQIDVDARLLQCAQHAQMGKSACTTATEHDTHGGAVEETRQPGEILCMAAAHRIDALVVATVLPTRHGRRFAGAGLMQHHQVLAFHAEARFRHQALLEFTQCRRSIRSGDEDHLVRLAKRTPGPGSRLLVTFVDQIVVLIFQFVVPVLALPGAGLVRIFRATDLRRHQVGAADSRKCLRQIGRHRMGVDAALQWYDDKNLRIAPRHPLRSMTKMVIDGTRKHLVQRQRMEHQQALEVGAAEHGHGRVAQRSDVGGARLLQDQTGLADAFAGADLVVQLQLAVGAAARHAQPAADQEKHGVGGFAFAVDDIATRHHLQRQEAAQILQYGLAQAAKHATGAQDIQDALVGDRRLSHARSLPWHPGAKAVPSAASRRSAGH